MTPDEMRIAIAETQGFQVYDEHIVKPDGTPVDCEFLTEEGVNNIFPNYCNDLNAMHEVEKELNQSQKDDYILQLAALTHWTPAFSSAAQRAEAYLRVKGLWRE